MSAVDELSKDAEKLTVDDGDGDAASDGTATDDGEDPEDQDVDPSSLGKSRPPTSGTWDMGDANPKTYVYEDRYQTDGKVDDEKLFPELRNHFTNTPARLFNLRGPNYLSSDGGVVSNNKALKQPSEEAAYTVIGIRVFQSPNSMEHAAQSIMPLKEFMAEQMEKDKTNSPGGDAPMYLVVCWNFCNFFHTEYTSVVHLCRRNMKISSDGSGEDPALDKVLSRFLEENDEGKNNKLKFVPRFLEQNAALQAAIDMCGGERPVLVGNRLATTYFKGDGYLEIDMDVGSKTITTMLNGVMLKASGDVTYDECFVIEGQKEDELPERSLFSVRWNRCLIDDVVIKLDAMGHICPE